MYTYVYIYIMLCYVIICTYVCADRSAGPRHRNGRGAPATGVHPPSLNATVYITFNIQFVISLSLYTYIYIYIYILCTESECNGPRLVYTSRFVRVILAQGPCSSSPYRSKFNGGSPKGILCNRPRLDMECCDEHEG